MAAQNGMSRRDMYTTCVIITVYLWIFPCYGYYEMKKVILFLCQGLEEYEASAFLLMLLAGQQLTEWNP